MLLKLCCLAFVALITLGCATEPSTTAHYRSARWNDIKQAEALRHTGYAHGMRAYMDAKERGQTEGAQFVSASPREIHAFFEKWSQQRAAFHPIPVARMVRVAHAQPLASARAEIAAQRATDDARSGRLRSVAWTERSHAGAMPSGAAEIEARWLTPGRMCDAMDPEFVRAVYFAELHCTGSAETDPSQRMELMISY